MSGSSELIVQSYHQASGHDRENVLEQFNPEAPRLEPVKEYPGMASIALPEVRDLPELSLAQVIASRGGESVPQDIEALAQILYLTFGVTGTDRKFGGYLRRTCPTAGALSQGELYVAVRDVAGLEDGLYYYAAPKNALILLRQGDYCLHEAGRPVRLTFFITAIVFRCAVKYLVRAFRYALMDAGHLAENLDLVMRAEGAEVELSYDFDDQAVNALLGVDSNREFCLVIGRVFGGKASARTGPIEPADESLAQASRIYSQEAEFPEISRIYQATCQMVSPVQFLAPGPEALGLEAGPGRPLSDGGACPDRFNFAEAVIRRRSKRNYVVANLSSGCLARLASLLCAQPGQTIQPEEQSLQVGILADRVEGLESGFYYLDRAAATLGLVRSGQFLEEMSAACLDQVWVKRASLNFLFMVNLERMEEAWGPRGYRHALITAGRLGHRIYLGSTALGLGALSIGALYDDETAAVLRLNPASRLVYLLVSGRVKG
ncbi:MAG: SagB family peptide dehydrogenase [Deltaproteobacteria bacterium]|nr:SagB family peptide dehydrogenase [Deltaproteobacteria bacterium]